MQHERAKKLILRDSRTEKSRKSFEERSVRKKRAEKIRRLEEELEEEELALTEEAPENISKNKEKSQKIAEGKTGCGEGEPGRRI
mgnify:CR=1 FL=1